jgi:hypothetical protein
LGSAGVVAAPAKLIPKQESIHVLSARSAASLVLIAFVLPIAAGCGSGAGDPATPADGGAVELPACVLGPSMEEIEKKLFRSIRCSICHGRDETGALPLQPTNLDLSSPGLAARMVDQPAEMDTHKGKCQGRILVPKDDPLGGLFVAKVVNPPCGLRMPQDLPMLKPDEIACVKRWAILAARSVP